MANRPDFIANTVVQIGENNRWHEVGAAWRGNNDTIVINLFATPVDGKIVLTVPKERDVEPRGRDEK